MSIRTLIFYLFGSLSLLTALRADNLEIYPTAEKMPCFLQGPFALADDGTVLALENAKIHRSADSGRTWESKDILPENWLDREERAILKTSSGTILCAFLNDKERKEGSAWGSGSIDDWVLPTYVIRSTDNGKTWSEPIPVQNRWCGAIRSMIQHSSGRILLVGQSVADWSHTTIVYYSDDDGLTWKAGPEIALEGQGDHNGAMEGTIIERPDSSLYLLIRTTRGVFYESTSTDRGETWSPTVPSGIENNFCCGTMAKLSDGKYVLLWNREWNVPAYNHPEGEPYYMSRQELSIAFSDDAQNWSQPLVIAAHHDDGTKVWHHYRVSYPYICEITPGQLWITTMQGDLRMAVAEQDLLNGIAAREKALTSPDRKRILFLGDSTTALRQGVVTYEEQIGKKMEKDRFAVDLVNSGVPGYNTRMAKNAFAELAAGPDPDFVTIQFGINDSAIDVWADPPQTQPRISEEEFAENLKWMIAQFQAKSIPVLLMTTSQMRWSEKTLGFYGKVPYDPNDPLSFTNVSLRRYNGIIRQVAEETGVMLVDIFDMWDKIAAEQGEEAISAMLLEDKMHPSTAGQILVADVLYPILCEKLNFSVDESIPVLKKADQDFPELAGLAGDTLPAAPAGFRWRLDWHDEFNGTEIDWSKWETSEGPRHDGFWSKEAFRLDGEGNLEMSIFRNDEGNLIDGCLRTRNIYEKAKGFFVARMKMQKEPGHWIAFWLMNFHESFIGNGSADGAEIDIMEKPWLDDKVNMAIHWDGYGEEHRFVSSVAHVENVMDGFHTFALWWSDDFYRFYMDGRQLWETKADGICTAPLYLKLSDETAPWGGDINQANLPDHSFIDYVRVYDLEPVEPVEAK